MNRLAWLSPRKRHQAAVQRGRQRHRDSIAAVARHRRTRPVRSADQAGRADPQADRVQYDSCRDSALAGSLSSPSTVALPQRVVGVLHRKRRQHRRHAAPPRRIKPRQVPPQRRQRPAVARQCGAATASSTCSLPAQRIKLRPQRRLNRKIKPAPRRRRKRPAKLRLAQRLNLKRRPRRRAARISCRGTPPRSGNSVRRLSCRSTTSHSAPCSAARSSAPRQPHRKRDRVGRRRPPSRRSRNHSRRCAYDSGDLGRTRQRTKRRPRRRPQPQHRRQRRNARRLEQAADAKLDIKARRGSG